MFDVEIGEVDGTGVENGATKVGLRISPPTNALVLQQFDQMRRIIGRDLPRLRIRKARRNSSPLRATSN